MSTHDDGPVDPERFGLIFTKTYTGSMCGAGLGVFAVWPYVLAHTRRGRVELNPRIVAACLGCTPEVVVEAITWLQRSDPTSRSQLHAGKRLHHLGGFLYHVPGAKLHRDAALRAMRRALEKPDAEEAQPSATNRDETQRSAAKRGADDDVLTKEKSSGGTGLELQQPKQEQDTASSRGIQPELIPGVAKPVVGIPGRRKGELPPYSATFEEAWSIYGPLRSGHSKIGAWRQWLMREREGHASSAMLAGAKLAAEYHRRVETPPTRIKHFETFVGPDLHFQNDYTVRGDPSPHPFRKQSHREAGDSAAAERFAADPSLGRLPQLPPDAPFKPTW